MGAFCWSVPLTSTPQLRFKTPHIPTNRDHEALDRGTLGGLGTDDCFGEALLEHRVLDLGVPFCVRYHAFGVRTLGIKPFEWPPGSVLTQKLECRSFLGSIL